MKNIVFSFFLASSFFFPSSAQQVESQPTAIDEIVKLLSLWSDLYPQCYQDVYDIKELIAALQTLFGTSNDELSGFHADFSSYAQSVSSYLQNFSRDSGAIQAYLADLVYYHSSDSSGQYLASMNDILSQLSTLISEHFSKLPDFNTWSPDVKVTNFADIKEILRELFNEITVFAHCTLDSDASIKVNAQFDFDYDYLLPSKQFHYKANQSNFSLNSYTRYHPRTWLYNADDSMGGLVTPSENTAATYDFLDFMCSCGNALVSQNQDVSMLLCQILGFFKSGKGDDEQLKTMATTAADGAQQDLDSLKSAFHASSLEDVASQYFVDLSIDEKFDTDFLGFGGGAGNHCPDFIDIGPIPFSKIHDSMSDYTLHFSTAGLLSFFDICRQSFTVVWYLFFLTICIFLARFGWAFLKPIFRSLTSVLDW